METRHQLSQSKISAQHTAFSRELTALLVRQVREYTGDMSSSVPVETARTLLDSLCYCIGLNSENRQDFMHGRLAEKYQAGLARLRAKIPRAHALWQQLCTQLPQAKSRSLSDTLRSIGGFWTAYDPRFFAREIPCSIDYQLAVPVPEALGGIDYLLCYLQALALENCFLCCFSVRELNAVLSLSSRDSCELLVNLFEPAFVNALGCMILCRSPSPLLLTEAELKQLYTVFEPLSPRQIEKKLLQAGSLLSGSLFGKPAAHCYFDACCRQLAQRITVLRDVNGLSGVFMTGS